MVPLVLVLLVPLVLVLVLVPLVAGDDPAVLLAGIFEYLHLPIFSFDPQADFNNMRLHLLRLIIKFIHRYCVCSCLLFVINHLGRSQS